MEGEGQGQVSWAERLRVRPGEGAKGGVTGWGLHAHCSCWRGSAGGW